MNDRVKSWLFVSVQVVILVLLIFFTDASTSPSSWIVMLGNVIKVVSVVILLVSFYDLRKSLTPLPTPKANGELQVRGLYRFVRHPMYLGVLALSLGIAVTSASVTKYVLVITLYVLFSYKSRYEESLLIQNYPAYKAYMKKTRRFTPTLHRN